MKSEGSLAKRFIQDGLLIYSSGTLHHQKSSVRGYLYKRPTEAKFFQAKSFYKRYFIISTKQNFVQVQEQPVTKKYKTILKYVVVIFSKAIDFTLIFFKHFLDVKLYVFSASNRLQKQMEKLVRGTSVSSSRRIPVVSSYSHPQLRRETSGLMASTVSCRFQSLIQIFYQWEL